MSDWLQHISSSKVILKYVMNCTLWNGYLIFDTATTHNWYLTFLHRGDASPWYLTNDEKQACKCCTNSYFSLLWLFNVAGSAVALCSLRLWPAGPGALGAGSRVAAFLLLLQRRKAGGSEMSPEHTPHTGRRLTDNSQISLPWYV